MKKKKRTYISLFEKSVLAFLVIGIIPLIMIGFSLFSSFSNNLEASIISNISQMELYVSKNLTDIVREMEETSRYIYGYEVTEYDYFYEIFHDQEQSESSREMLVTAVLRNILYMNQYIDHVYFIDADDHVYSSMRPPERMLNTVLMQQWHEENKQADNKQGTVKATHSTGYFYYSAKLDMTFVRNVMDTKTIKSAQNEILGTLYIDMNIDRLRTIINEVSVSETGEIRIIDTKENLYVYHQEEYEIGRRAWDMEKYLAEMKPEGQFMKAEEEYLIYSPVPDTDWIIVAKVPFSDIASSYQALRKTTLLILVSASILIGVIYLFYSRMTSSPIRRLKEAMVEIQNGILDTRVEIKSNDETGILADGLNQMAENLQKHIDQVYLAEIRQRDAELEALKTQIQPHYLYNTLEAIRMMAFTNDDFATAEMLDSLSKQLKYLIGKTSDRVSLRAEIDSIRGYFKLMRMRFDNRFSLEVNITEDLLLLEVPQLILQPVVENAIQHGLRPKPGEGQVGISARQLDDILEITVIDDGVGINAEKLNQVRQILASPEPGKRVDDNWESIGMKNVYERIKLNFGPAYGLEITSHENLGTIVKYRLPVITRGE